MLQLMLQLTLFQIMIEQWQCLELNNIKIKIIINNRPMNTPGATVRRSTNSPYKTSNHGQISTQSKRDLSPRRCNTYTVHHEEKLKVFIKFKPPTQPHNCLNVTYLNEKEVEIERQSTNNKIYSYDRVFHENVTSDRVFQEGCMDIVDNMIQEGQNGLIFVYGHTGTGKTYTMGLIDSVDSKTRGIVPETIRYIMKIKDHCEQKFSSGMMKSKMEVSLSFNQIYMDEVYDMLDFECEKKLQIRESQTNKEPYIENNISIVINTIEEAYQLLNIGLDKRRVGEQKINKRSSRGHGLITLTMSFPTGKSARLCFVDLAGSERVKQSESMGKALKQAVHINTSLSALESLLMNIDEQSVRMYRSNKLTRLLQPFLESGKIRLFVTSNYENTQPLEFAKRCKGIKFMEKEVMIEAPPPPPITKQISGSSCSPLKNNHHNQRPGKSASNMGIQIEKLQKQNKLLMQLLTNSIVIISKISKLAFNVVGEQNTHSSFSLSHDYNLSMFDRGVEETINSKINELQENQEQIVERCNKLASALQSSIGSTDKNKDDSVNTSVSNNNKSNLISGEMQKLINGLPSQSDQLHQKINQIGFAVFQAVKNLSALCDYRNVYKKQAFTYAIKEELLEGRNRQLESGIAILLRHIKSNENLNSLTKITKELKEMGIQVSSKNLNKISKTKLAPVLTSTRPRQSETSPISRSFPIPGLTEKTKKYEREELFDEEDPGELFQDAHRNENRNLNNKLDEAKPKKIKQDKPADRKKDSNQTLGRSGRKIGGLILIQDL